MSDGRLIVVSNRLPKGDVPSGGLVFAVHEMLSQTGGLWIGAADPTKTAEDGLTQIGKGVYDRATFALSEDEHRHYYLGYSNSMLWPLFHHRADLLSFDQDDFDGYARVNARVARAIAEVAAPGDTIWIQDYHFLMVAKYLRELGVRNRIGLFLHIPCPNVSDLMALPQGADLPGWLAAHDLVGLQTQRDVSAVSDLLRLDRAIERLPNGGWIRKGHRFAVLSFPIGIDAQGFADTAASAPELPLRMPRDAPLILGVDRLDYSKGLVQRFDGFDTYLARRDAGGPRPTFLQIAPGSREDVAAYQEIRDQLERRAGAINGAHADLDWTPLRYVRRNIDRAILAGLYRRADVALVTPLADGMNLVAKEFVAAQDDEDPGVLILSHFAGAAEQLRAALLVNPFDTSALAEAIDRAIHMPLAERLERHAALRPMVFDQDITWWRDNFLRHLRGHAGFDRAMARFSAP
ncbi:alpha,alpha-trehalose-phosphate synthase (UDP-forming) [Jannaschia pohangensis]|nr:trehalose-6-phosphate synthase [Jannaschia pohangensis]